MDLEEKLEDFIATHGLSTSGRSGRSFIFDCPACNGHKKLYIDKNSGISVCFKAKTDRCPKPGSRASVALSLLSGLSIKQVNDELFTGKTQLFADHIEVSFDKKRIKLNPAEISDAELPADALPIEWPESINGLNYLLSRGLVLDQLKSLSVMYSEGLRRVIFPVIIKNSMKGWQGRSIDPIDKNYRMYNYPGNWRASTCMFLDKCIPDNNYLIIAEGAISSMKFKDVGNYIATMGKSISKAQLQAVVDFGATNIYLALDRDAFDKIDKIRSDLTAMSMKSVTVWNIPIPQHRDDFGDCTYDECAQAFKEAYKLTGNEIIVEFE